MFKSELPSRMQFETGQVNLEKAGMRFFLKKDNEILFLCPYY